MSNTEQLPSGRYRGIYYDPIAKKNRRVPGTYTSKREAKRLATIEELALRSGRYRDPDLAKITYSEYFENHWLPHKRGETNTMATYTSHYRMEIKEEFGSVRLEDITTDRVQRWVTKMIDKGTTPATVRLRVLSLSAVLGAQKGVSALRAGRIQENPCKGVELPHNRAREADVYSPAEAYTLIERMHPWYRPLVALAYDTGWRWGELNGLWVSDLTDDFTRVHLNRTLLEVPKRESGLATPFAYKSYPKEKRKRASVELSPEVAAELRELVRSRQLQPEDRLFSIPADKDCTTPKRSAEWPGGLPISRSNFNGRYWRQAHVDPATGQEDIRRRRFHDLRGSHISGLLAAGVDVIAVQARVGHTQLSTTQIYVDALPDADQRVLEGLATLRASVKTNRAERDTGSGPTPR